MIHISHRGNVRGVNHSRENSLSYIDEALSAGFDCEIDLRMKDGVPHLGHDTPDHVLDEGWFSDRKKWLWVHVKEYEALVWLMGNHPDAVYFCHESDRYTLVSNGKIWSHDLSNHMTADCIVPLLSLESVYSYAGRDGFHAVCSDYVEETRRIWG
jgi:glycerophosphoryl diester phosphodiesterase